MCIFEKKSTAQNFFTFHLIEKKLARIVQLTSYVIECLLRVDYFSSMLNYGRKILNLNIVTLPLQFRK